MKWQYGELKPKLLLQAYHVNKDPDDNTHPQAMKDPNLAFQNKDNNNRSSSITKFTFNTIPIKPIN
jgi:hypothetical protein